MAIQVTCPNCLTRFAVADQHAGKEGPCPKCKGRIKIPTLEEQVVVIAPTDTGPKDAKGRSVLKTIKWRDTEFQPVVAAAVAAVVLLVLLGALLVRVSSPELKNNLGLLAAGAAVVGPLSAWAGYTFLRDAELEPFRGGELWLRALGCGAVYALLWGLYIFVAGYIGESDWQKNGLEVWQMLVPSAMVIGFGILAAFVALDLEPTVGFVHCAMYFAITIGLRLVVGLSAIPGLGPAVVAGGQPFGGS